MLHLKRLVLCKKCFHSRPDTATITSGCTLYTCTASSADMRVPSLLVRKSGAWIPASRTTAWHRGMTRRASGCSAALRMAAFSRSSSPSWPTSWETQMKTLFAPACSVC